MKTVECIHIDFDGTLANSIPNLKELFYSFLQHNALQTSKSFDDLNGPSLREIINQLCQENDCTGQAECLYSEYSNYILEHVTEIQPMPYAGRFLKYCQQLCIHLNIVSSRDHNSILRWLHHYNFEDYVQDIIAADHVIHSKPDPECYVKSIARSNISATRAIAIEDSKAGCKAALAAGLNVIWLSPSLAPISMPIGVTQVQNLCGALELISC